MAATTLAFALALFATLQIDNLDFREGTLAGWSGQGFALHATQAKSGRKTFAVSSADRGAAGNTGRLERTLKVPPEAVYVRCRVQTTAREALLAGKLDVVLRSGNEVLPRQVHTSDGWLKSSSLLASREGAAYEYRWLVPLSSRNLTVTLIDDDARPGHHLVCSNVRILTRADVESQEFGQFMVQLQKQHKLSAMARYDTAHFTALSNAEEEFSKARLQNCEMLHRRFFEHFRAKGFTIKEPTTKLMVAIFENETGFKAYLGPQELRGAQGFYHTITNRLIIYDYRENKQFQTIRQEAEARGKKLAVQVQREAYLDTLNRQVREFAADQNISLIVHEVGHQLSFNCGMFNREGDPPFWVVEGFACYCEPTEAGRWLGIGNLNPERLRTLERAKGQYVPLRKLVTGDGWKAGSQRETLLFYAQSWALFHYLMEKRPQTVWSYLKLIYPRRTPDHRLTDFQQAFGADLDALERDYLEWVKSTVTQYAAPRQ